MYFRKTKVWGLDNAVHAMHNILRYTDNDFISDSGYCKGGLNAIGCENCSQRNKCDHDFDYTYQLGDADLKALQTNMEHLNKIHVVVDINHNHSGLSYTWDTNYASLRECFSDTDVESVQEWLNSLPYAKELIYTKEV